MEQPDLHRDFIYLFFQSKPGVLGIIIRDYNDHIDMPKFLEEDYGWRKIKRIVSQYPIRWKNNEGNRTRTDT